MWVKYDMLGVPKLLILHSASWLQCRSAQLTSSKQTEQCRFSFFLNFKFLLFSIAYLHM
jgi:hypothetical protein